MSDLARNRYYGTGHRKIAVARVWIAPGSGVVLINNRPGDKYLGGLSCPKWFSSRSTSRILSAGST